MKITQFRAQFAGETGIKTLMEDLGAALAGNHCVAMLGGGNPSHIPEVLAVFRSQLEQRMADVDEFARLVGNYDPPQGNPEFVAAIVQLMNATYGWNITTEHVAVVPGSQAGFFMLFNLFAGPMTDGTRKKILFPMTPEYIGYADLGLGDDCIASLRPLIRTTAEKRFKYQIDFDNVRISDEIGALCVSRPSNPTGNVLTDEELARLIGLAEQHGIPLIVDNAYGLPFPNIIFTDAKLHWQPSMVLCFSLSKLGLPATRTGFVIAAPEIIQAIVNVNAIINLASGGIGQRIALELIRNREILTLSQTLIKPYYAQRLAHALTCIRTYFYGLNYYLHEPEGGMFLWVWFPDLPISSHELYVRLKQRGVVIVSGHHFFAKQDSSWPHAQQCIRVTYSQSADTVALGIRLIAEEVQNSDAVKHC